MLKKSVTKIKNTSFVLYVAIGEMYYSLKRYKAKEDDELSFPIGVTLQILRKNLDGWWTAM